ncbi:MAG: hypothetical protein ACM3UP_00575 [Methanocella sp.]
MPRGRDFASAQEAHDENLATAKKVITALELMRDTGEMFGHEFFRKLLLDTANANIRFLEKQATRIAQLESQLREVEKHGA